MRIESKLLGLAGVVSALAWLVQTTGCTTDNTTDAGGAAGVAGTAAGGASGSVGASGSAGASGSSSGTGGGSGATGAVCGAPTQIPANMPTITNFDDYDGTMPSMWSFAFGGDSSLMLYSGTFAYGDRSNGLPETFELGAGHDSMYAMRIADTLAENYGGGMGLWISNCIDASQFTGITFWVRGDSPSPSATLTVLTRDTLPNVPGMAGGDFGTCAGDATTCVHPKFSFAVTDTWTQIQAPWTGFTPGDAAGTPVAVDGKNITQIQFGVGLNFVPGEDGGPYVAVPAPYELVVDELSFY